MGRLDTGRLDTGRLDITSARCLTGRIVFRLDVWFVKDRVRLT